MQPLISLSQGFITEFKKTFRSTFRLPPRPDQWGRFFAWPLVFLLSKTHARPEALVFASFLCGIIFSLGLIAGDSFLNPFGISLFIFMRIIFDCADGGLARVTGQIRSLGGLLDISSDFICTVVLFAAISFALVFYENGQTLHVILIGSLALFVNLCVTTMASFRFFSINNAHLHNFSDLKSVFLNGPSNDRPFDIRYSKTINYLKTFYHFTWRPITALILKLNKNENYTQSLSQWEGHLYGLGATGSHLFLLIFLVISNQSLWWLLAYQFVISLVILIYQVLRS